MNSEEYAIVMELAKAMEKERHNLVSALLAELLSNKPTL